MGEAIAHEARAQRALLDGDADAGRAAYREAAAAYRGSWESAPPGAVGRLVGMLKAAVLAGAGVDEGEYVHETLGDPPDPTPPTAYALALAALATRDDDAAADWAGRMRGGSPSFERAAGALGAVARGDADTARAHVAEIVADFEGRDDHLTGVPFADTALVVVELARRRGMAVGVGSALLPPATRPTPGSRPGRRR